MALSATESGGEKAADQFPGERLADHEAAQAEHVQIVVLNPLVRGEGVVDQACPDARNLVGGNAGTDATPADGQAAINFSPGHSAGQGHDKIRIVIVRHQPFVTVVDDFVG